MKLPTKYFLVALLFLSHLISKGQPILSLGKGGLIGFPDSIAANNHASFNAFIKNSGNQPYSGNISLNYSVNSITQFTNMHSKYFPGINPGDSAFINIPNFFFDATVFPPNATSIVVVWTSSGGYAKAGDSTTVAVFINGNSSISPLVSVLENESGNQIASYPNPSDGNISIDFDLQGVLPQNIQIALFNSAGQKIFEKEIVVYNGIYKIPVYLNVSAKGQYYLSICKEGNYILQRKIIIER